MKSKFRPTPEQSWATWSSFLGCLFIFTLGQSDSFAQTSDPFWADVPLVILDKQTSSRRLVIDPDPQTDLTPAEIAEREELIRQEQILNARKREAEASGLCNSDSESMPEICRHTSTNYSFNAFEIPRAAAPFQVQFLVNSLGASSERLAQLLPNIPEWEARHACGGAVIAPGWILSAAHCFAIPGSDGSWTTDPEKFSLRLDVENIAADDSKSLPIQELIIHPKFSVRNNENDLALVRYSVSETGTDAYMPWFLGFDVTTENRLSSVHLKGEFLELMTADGDAFQVDISTQQVTPLNQITTSSFLPAAPVYVEHDHRGRMTIIPWEEGPQKRLGRTRLERPSTDVSPSGSHVVLRGEDAKGEIWDLQSRKRLARFESDPEFRRGSVAFSSSSDSFLLTSDKGQSELRDMRSGDVRAQFNHSLPVRYSKPGPKNLVIVEGALGTVEIIDLNGETILHRLFHGGGHVRAEIEKNRILTWSRDGRIRLFDLKTGQEELHIIFPKETNHLQPILVSQPDKPARVQRVQMASLDPQANTGDPLTAYGWGKTRATDQELSSAVLRKLSLEKIDWPTCNNLRGRDGTSQDTTGFCVIGSGRKTCRGDSGGPLLDRDQLVGIVSRGSGLCWSDARPTIFSSVASARPWIRSVICSNNRTIGRDPALCGDTF